MERRDFLVTAAATAFASSLIGPQASAADKKAPPANSNKSQTFLKALNDCLTTGRACHKHCMDELANGNKEMAKCSRTIQDLISVCTMMTDLVASGSSMAPKFAKLCAETCDNCAKACKEHEAHWSHGMHAECKACYEACVEGAKAAKAFA